MLAPVRGVFCVILMQFLRGSIVPLLLSLSVPTLLGVLFGTYFSKSLVPRDMRKASFSLACVVLRWRSGHGPPTLLARASRPVDPRIRSASLRSGLVLPEAARDRSSLAVFL